MLNQENVQKGFCTGISGVFGFFKLRLLKSFKELAIMNF